MMKRLSVTKNEKGQGLTEYVLIIAFIAGVAIAMFGGSGSLKDTLVNTVTETNSKLAGLFDGENKYVTAFKKWSNLSKSDLENEDAAARLAADQAALDNIAKILYGKTQEELKNLTGQDMYANKNKNFYGTTNGQNDGPKGDEYGNRDYSVLLMNYEDKDTQNASGIDIVYKNETYLNQGWLQGTDGDSNATSNQDWKNTRTSTRYFYSDGMINNDYGSQVRAQFHVGSDGKVDSVRVFAVQNRATTSGRFTQIEGLDRTYDATGAHATGTK